MTKLDRELLSRDLFAETVDLVSAYLAQQREDGGQSIEFELSAAQALGLLKQVPAAGKPGVPVSARPESRAWSVPNPAAPAPVRAAKPSAASKPPSTGSNPARDALKDIAERVRQCSRCPLHEKRTHAVPGQGHEAPEIMFIGEGPGADEDVQGLAFVGRAGQLLTDIVAAMGLTRDQVFIGNIVKCRPPENRQPLPDEMSACMPYLTEQIAVLKPKVIVALGATAVRGLMQSTEGITKLRGHWMKYEGIDLMPTFHPAYLLRNASGKRPVWEDMKAVLGRLGRTPPGRPAAGSASQP